MVGRVLGNRYEIIENIGGGGMALVYKAKCRLLNRFVAVKVLRQEFTQDDEFIKKFNRESQAAASLSHHNIVNIYDVGNEDGLYYIVMEYVKGKTLKDYIKAKGRLEIDEALNIAIQISEALNHAHKNKIIHRDIKPQNIMINEYREIKVMDFGIARATTSNTQVDGGDIIGSVHYFSPEQARGGYTDEKSDIYSLGIVLYEMVFGRVPFEGDTPINVALKQVQQNIEFDEQESADIPAGIIEIIRKCAQKEQLFRYQNAVELVNDLRKIKYNKNEMIEISQHNSDNSPTMIMKPIKEDIITEQKLSAEDKIKKPVQKEVVKSQNVKNKKTGKAQLTDKSVKIIAVVSALIVAVVIFVVGIKIRGFLKTPTEVDMPFLVGLNQEIATEKLEELGLILKVREEKFDDKYKEGSIVWQSIPEASKVKEGFTIEVDISKGYKFIEIPSLVGKNELEATELIQQSGLVKGEVTTADSEKPEGEVINQFPSPQDKVKEGTPIDLVLSKGTKTDVVIMPKLIGVSIDEAKSQLAKLGLTIGSTKEEKNENFEKNQIINQFPNAGDEIGKDIKVDLVISNSASTSNNVDKNNADTKDSSGTNSNTGTETKKGKAVINLSLPEKETTNVKIYKVVDNKEELLYNQDLSYDGNKVQVVLYGTGSMKVKVYYDDVEKGVTDIAFKEE